ncbi:MAG: DNA polymerase III subunit delta [Oscillospiraceae bacterium]|jgi:DNA polymerase-3 subunit delta|nr:DNA polymerase III subunit delta [Oscillospiraceae bacterium]
MPRITYKDISKKKFFSNTQRIYFLYGKDKYIVKECEQTLIFKLLGSNKNNFDLIKLDGENINLDKLILSLDMYPICGNLRCILIKNIDIEGLNSSDIKKINDIIKNIPEFSVIIISQPFCEVNEKKSSKWKKFLSLVSDVGDVIDCSITEKKEIEDKIISLVNKYGKIISSENADAVLSRCGKNLDIVSNELGKLCSFESEKEISRDSIEKIVCANLEYNVFEICKFILSKNIQSAYECLDKIFLFKEEPTLVLSIISSTYVDMYRFKVCRNFGISESLMPKFFDYKGKEYKIRSAKYNCGNIHLNNIRKSIDILLRADEEIKTKSISARVIIDIVIIKLINLVSKNG